MHASGASRAITVVATRTTAQLTATKPGARHGACRSGDSDIWPRRRDCQAGDAGGGGRKPPRQAVGRRQLLPSPRNGASPAECPAHTPAPHSSAAAG